MKSFLGAVLFFISINAYSQTSYMEDSRGRTMGELSCKSIDLANSCIEKLIQKKCTQTGFDSVRLEWQSLEKSLKEYEYSSRYRPFIGLCNILYKDKLAAFYELCGDTAFAYKLLKEQYTWLKETYQYDVFPIKFPVQASDQYLEYNMSFVRDPVYKALLQMMRIFSVYEDARSTADATKLFVDLGIWQDKEESKYAHVLHYKSLLKLKVPLNEKVLWLEKTMKYFKSIKVGYGNWEYDDWDLSLLFKDLLQEWKQAGNDVSLQNRKLAAQALIEMYHEEDAIEIYKEILSEKIPLSFDDAIDFYDFFRSKGNNIDALRALNNVDQNSLNCVDVSVVVAKYAELGETQKAKEYQTRHKKCLRESKKFERYQKHRQFSNTFKGLSDAWKEKVNISVNANPLVGLNVKQRTSTNLFNFLPIGADIRTGAFIHEFRWNHFFELYGSRRFTNGNLKEPKIENEIINEWRSLKGNDYSYYLGVVVQRTSDDNYDEKWKGYHSFGIQYLWGNFTSLEETATVLLSGNSMTQEILVNPVITRTEWLLQWKYSRFYTKFFNYTLFTGVGFGNRTLAYNSSSTGVTEEMLRNPQQSTFYDARLVQENWTGPKLTMRAGIRIGFTIK